jgi:hypothetical protein
MRATAVLIRAGREVRTDPRDGPGLATFRSMEGESSQARRPVGPDRRRGASQLVLAIGLTTVVALAAAEWQPSRSARPTPSWQSDLDRFSVALANKDVDAAAEAWADAYRSAMSADGGWRAPVAIAGAWRELGRRAGSDASRVAGGVRGLYLTALIRAFEREDMDGVLVIGSALHDLGDLEGAERVLLIARRLATSAPGEEWRPAVEALESRLTAVKDRPDVDGPAR